LKEIPFKIQVSFLVGYLNQTFQNSISPFIVFKFATTSYSLVCFTSIFDGSSIIANIFFADSSPLTAEGPNCYALPAANAPNMIQNMH